MSILESLQDGVYIVSDRHEIEYINPILQKEFGPIQERKCFEYFHDRLKPCPWCQNQRVFDGETVRWEWYSVKNRKTYDLFDTPLFKSDGTVSKLEIFRDITEHKRTEKALCESELKYRLLFNKANDAIFHVVYTPDGSPERFIEANEMACRILGYTRQEILTITPSNIVAIDNRGDLGLLRKRLFAEKSLVFETVLIGKAGQRIPVEFNAHLFDFMDRPTVLGIARDISKRKRDERSLRQSERKFRKLSNEFHTILNAIPDRVMLMAPDLTVTWANASAAEAAGRTITEMPGEFCYRLSEGRSTPCENCPTVECFLSGSVQSQVNIHEGRVYDKRTFPIKEGGRVNSVILITRDITEKTTLEAEAMQASHLAAIGELAASVAHQINNPINGVINCAQLLINRTKPGDQANDIACRILEESERIANTVSSLLKFAKGGQGGKQPAHFEKILTDTLNLTLAQIQKEGVHLKLEIPPDLPQIIANKHLLQQVLLNILNNARFALNRKYPKTHKDKIIKISAERQDKHSIPHLCITVYDQGIGIAANILDRVTDPLFSTKPVGQGTGLGLTISRKIISDHDGRFSIDSVENEFTKVVVELPARRRKKDEGQNSGRR